MMLSNPDGVLTCSQSNEYSLSIILAPALSLDVGAIDGIWLGVLVVAYHTDERNFFGPQRLVTSSSPNFQRVHAGGIGFCLQQ